MISIMKDIMRKLWPASTFPFSLSSGVAGEGDALQDNGDCGGGTAWPAGGVGAGVVPLGPPPRTLLPKQTSLFR